jgi:hypothetical protein
VRAGHFDQRLLIRMGDHLELAVRQAFPTLRALKATRLPAKNIQKIHGFFVPGIKPAKPVKLIAPTRGKALTAGSELVPVRSFAV